MLRPEDLDLTGDVFRLDLMGAAEYEWGAIPDALRVLFRAPNLVAFSMVVPGATIKPNYRREDAWRKQRRAVLDAAKAEGRRPPRAKKLPPAEDATVFVICLQPWRAEIENRIRSMAAGTLKTRDPHCMEYALDPFDQGPRTVGWLELNNGWFATVDVEMWRKAAELFGAPIEEPIPVAV